jgi:hypothetical protein
VKKDDFNYHLTKHGRQRFRERVGPCHDGEILRNAISGVPGYTMVWAKDRSNSMAMRLVTVLHGFLPHIFKE